MTGIDAVAAFMITTGILACPAVSATAITYTHAASALAERGYGVHLLERKSIPGGRAMVPSK